MSPESTDARSAALWGLFLLALVYTLHVAQGLLLPITLSVLLSILLAPAMRGLRKLRLPDPVAAALILVVLVVALGYGMYRLWAPAVEWMAKSPEALHQIEHTLSKIKKPVEQVSQTTDQVERLGTVDNGQPTPQVQVKQPTLAETLLSGARSFVVQATLTFVLLYLILASGGSFVLKLVKLVSRLEEKDRVVSLLGQIERNVSGYLLTVTLINICLGVAVGVAMYLLRMPSPALWGVLAGLLNYIPYAGPIVMLTTLAVVASFTFDSPAWMVAVGGAYLALHTAESFGITPLLLGRRLMLSPVVVFFGILFWGWVWGITGALVAVPLLVAVKIVCAHVPRFKLVSELLSP
ncbi:MAG: AI-2E family transporter [Candidatus Acidiferrales bacterium]